MEVNQLKPRKALNKAFLKVKPNRAEMEVFKGHLIELLDGANDAESEEFHKNLVRDFLKKTYYDPGHSINTKGRNDLVIHTGAKASSPVGVILEAKKPTNAAEMVQAATKGDAPEVQWAKLNVKAMHELLLYYLRERITGRNLEVKHLIITNLREWFVFDAMTFDRLFAQDKKLVQQFRDFEAGRLADTRTDFFYREIAAPFIAGLETELSYTYFDIRDYERPLRNADKADDRKLIALYKLLSPEHLLKLPFVNDSNSLDKRFYSELLHIIGLTETKKGSKKLIERQPDGQRQTGTILEDAIIQLDSLDKINRLRRPGQYGDTQEERLFNVALELSLTWINRILFLKLLEAQLLTYHKGDGAYAFLNYRQIRSYDDLNGLFFQVLAKQHGDRNPDVKEAFRRVPYLNSSLFQPTNMEQETLLISNLRDDKMVPVYGQTVLKDGRGKRRGGEMKTLEYLFAFLESYDFSSEGSEEIQEENKALINASVLGLIFEKINGYKDGSFFTPGFITMYMCRETIRKAVVQKFNETKGWDCAAPEELYDRIEDRQEANEIVNSLKICDPAVGSGHFLVSALNEMIAVKNDLRILQDRDGHRLKEYQVEVVNDELIVTDEEGELFDYKPHSKESQRVQEALFHEKQTIIENCLFGVDINPNSVKICRLRLWIELLKNAYYKNETELETLPNIDINIKCGNSLVSRFDIDSDLKQALKKSKWTIDSYRVAVDTYRNAENPDQKRKMKELIADIKSDFRSEISSNDPKVKRLRKLSGELFQLTHQGQLFEMSKREKAAWEKKVSKLTKQTQKLEAEIEEIKANKIYENAFEWRFEFPEVLNVDGDFMGFDVVIGNPPYVKEYSNKEAFDGLRDQPCYQGKMDLWYMFGDLALEIAKKSFGLIGFIAQNNWITSSGASNFRNLMLQKGKILDFIDFGDYKVFDSAGIQTMIYIMQRSSKNVTYNLNYSKIIDSKINQEDAQLFLARVKDEKFEYFKAKINRKENLNKPIHFINSELTIILDKIRKKQNFTFDKKEIAQGIVAPQDFLNKKNQAILGDEYEVGDGIFIISETERKNLDLLPEENKLIKPYYTTSELRQYFGKKQNEYWVIYTDSSFNKKERIDPYPNIKKHLDRFQDIITSSNKPYGLHRARDEDFFQGEKIISLRKCSVPTFTYTDFECYVSQTFFSIKTTRLDTKYLTGLLNSRLIAFWLKYKGKMQGDLYQVDKGPLMALPLIEPSYNKQTSISILVDKILSLKKQDPTSDTSALEAEIDELVYGLYGLTEDEVGVVEGNSP